MKPVAVAAIGLLLSGAGLRDTAVAQEAVSSLGSCAGITNLNGFTIREARLEDPFWILRWRKPGAEILGAVEALKGKPYSFATVDEVSTVIESKAWLPDSSDAWIKIDYSDIGIVSCQNQQLDVVFRIFSAAIAPTLSALFEWSSKQKTANEVAGVVRTRAYLQVAPELGFDAARRFSAGGRVRATWASRHFPFGAFELQGMGSSEAHDVAASLVGGYESAAGWLRRASWRLGFDDSSTPASGVDLEERHFGVQFSGTSRPAGGVVTRFGGILDGGHLDSGFVAAQLPPGTFDESDFTGSGVFAGISTRRHQQSLAASYALVLGSTGNSFGGDWRKHLVDVAHEVWLPLANHRLFELEQRLTFGRLQTITVSPATERFFGGSSQQSLLLGDDWRLRTNPVIRSIPTNDFSVTASGAGGDRFVAYNSTTAVTIWGKPVVPPDLVNDQEFSRKLNGQLVSAQSTLDIVYRSGDPNFQAIRTTMLPGAAATLKRIEAAETSARTASTLPASAFVPCEDALHSSQSATSHAIADRAPQAFGWVIEMLPDGDNALADTVERCGVDLVAALKSAGVAPGDLEPASNDLKSLASTLETRFKTIDIETPARRAAADMAYARRALDVIMKQMNVTSISPAFVFDVAHVGPDADDPHSGVRYAIGGGIRFTLASTVSLTTTYAVNPSRRQGERSGALVFSLTTRNLFD